MDNFADSKTEL